MMCDKDCKVPTVYLAIFQLALRDKKIICIVCIRWMTGKTDSSIKCLQMESRKPTTQTKNIKCSFIFLNSSANFGQNHL